MYAGTEQPNPVTKGIKLLPCNPNLWKNPSNKKATLLMYPVVSKRAKPIYKIIILGKKSKTAPTPAMIPSTTKLLNSSLGIIEPIASPK